MKTKTAALDAAHIVRARFIIFTLLTGVLIFVGTAEAQTTGTTSTSTATSTAATTTATTTATSTATTTPTTTPATTAPAAPMPVSPTAPSGFPRDLEFGMTGMDVAALQTLLAMDVALYPEGLVTGYYGPLTQAAVTRFQERYGISPVGRAGPITRGALEDFMAGDAITVTPLVPNTGATGTGGADDMNAPIMQAATVTASADNASISWTTNEDAWGRVMYSTAWPFLYSAAPAVADPSFDRSTTVNLSNLMPGTTYYFVRESEDAAGNVMLSAPQQFTTDLQ